MDATIENFLIRKSIEAILELLKEMVANIYQWPSKHNALKKMLRIHELNVLTTLSS